jgi:transglutaminase-like putative cysteine protease
MRPGKKKGSKMKKSRKRFFVVLAIIFCAWIATLVIALRIPGRRETSVDFSLSTDEKVLELDVSGYGIYVDGQKIGYSISKQEIMERGVRISEKSFMNISAYGKSQEVTTYTVSEADKDFTLKTFYSELASGIHAVRTNGIVKRDSIYLTIETAGEKKSLTLAIGDRPFVPASVERVAEELITKDDTVYHYSIFEPTTEKVVDIDIRVGGDETIELDGETHSTFVVKAEMLGLESKLYFEKESGQLIMQSSPMGITIKRESLENIADFGTGSEGLKIYETYAIYPRGRVKKPRKTTHLIANIAGISAGYDFPVDERQMFADGRVEIRTFDTEGQFDLSSIDTTKFKEQLESTPFMPCDDKDIVSLARKITGNDDITKEDIRKLIDWVYANIKKSPTFSVPYAKEVLKNRIGDCNEHAVLFAALARALGVPTKVVVGIVYVDGAFYYHAWNEYYWGGWIACDPTFGQHLADATHIKLEEGTMLDFIKVIKLVGQLSITIVETSQ